MRLNTSSKGIDSGASPAFLLGVLFMTPEEEHVCFFYELGMATTEWAFVERALLQVITAGMPEPEQRATTAGYFAIENFRSKLAFTDSIIQVKFAHNKAWLQTWAGLVQRATVCSTSRNKLAHYSSVIFQHDLNQPGRRIALVQWIGLERQSWAGTFKGKPPPGSLCLRDIVLIELEFSALMIALTNFSSLIVGEPEPLPKSHEQPKGPPTIRVLANHIRELLGLPPKPSR